MRLPPDLETLSALKLYIAVFCMLGLFPFAARAVDPSRRISQYAHTAWRLQDGVFTGSPTSITQTADGYLWIGTAHGLLRFDGVTFKPAPVSSGIPIGSSITYLLAARDGSLWFTSGGLLEHLANGNLTQYRREDGRRHANTVLQTKDGNIWVVYTRQPFVSPLCRVDGTHMRCYGVSDGISLQRADTVAEDPDGSLWLANASEVYRWKDGSSSKVYAPRALQASSGLAGISVVSASRDGSMWVGVSQKGRGLGLQHFVHGTFSAVTLPGFSSSQLPVTAVLQDRQGSLWIGTDGDGLYRIHGSQVDHYRQEEGLTSNSVNDIYEDTEGDIWVTTAKGLDKFRDLSVITYSTTEGLRSDTVDSIAAAIDGSMWSGAEGYLHHLQNGRVLSVDREHGLPGSRVTSLLPDHLNRLWLGVDHNLFLYSAGSFTAIQKPRGVPIGLIFDLVEDSQGAVWVITTVGDAIYRVSTTQQVDVFPIPEARTAYALRADTHGGLWVGFDDGHLAYLKAGHWSPAALGSEGADGFSRQLALADDDAVFGATSLGIIAWQKGQSRKLGVKNGLPCEKTHSVVIDRAGTLWAYTECGLLSIRKAELQRWWQRSDAKLEVGVFDTLDGAQPAGPTFRPRAALATDGSIWFANGSVLQQVDPRKLYSNSISPPVFLESITADRRQYPLQNGLKLPAPSRDLEIDYTALSFRIPERVRFRYRLDGWDKDWQDVSNRRQAFYTNLRPGTYRFHVIACNSDGVWNETGATFDFSIAPRYYQTAWFQILCSLIAILLAWSLYLLRLRQATARIQERLSARLEERERIARELHDTLLQGVQGLMLRFHSIMKILPADQPTRKMMNDALDRADELMQQARQGVKDIRAAGMTESDLPNMIKACAEELQQDHSAAVKLTFAGTQRPIDVTVCTETYRIAREAMTNAFQHSGAPNIEVEVTYQPDHLRVSVRDDGKGIEPQLLSRGKAGHWGLSGVRERAEKIGGRLRILSQRAAGTEVELTVPGRLAYARADSPTFWDRIKGWTSKEDNR